MTNEAGAEPNLFELCLARRNSTKSNDGTKGQWDKGTFVFSIFQFGQKRPIKIIIYIINIYINNIYNNSYKNICRPTTLIPDNAKTICPNVPMSHFFLYYHRKS